MYNMYEILSDNLVRLRKSKNLTQAEFAEIIKYSDKSVSKWETGMSIPNIETLVEIADFYGMTLDDLIKKPVDSLKVEIVEEAKNTSKWTIYFLTLAVVWLIATVLFVWSILRGQNAFWRAFIWAVPFSCLVSYIYSILWKKRFIYLSISLLVWTFIAALYIQFFGNTYLLFVVGIPIQVIIILIRGLRKGSLYNTSLKQSSSIMKRLERRKKRNEINEFNKEKSE